MPLDRKDRVCYVALSAEICIAFPTPLLVSGYYSLLPMEETHSQLPDIKALLSDSIRSFVL